MVVQRLREYNLKIKPSKCKFARSKLEYLSHIIENGTIRPNPEKTAVVGDAKHPKTVKQVQAFLGLVSYYRKFIKGCSTIASPLIKLTEKNSSFNWTQECEHAFQTLKTFLISNEHVLALPDFDKEFVVEADASKFGIGGVLSQKNGRHYQPIAYYSKHLSKTERNYSTSERELLAIVMSVEHFKEYLYGRQFRILSDHEPLKFLATCDAPTPRLARLQRRLNIYNQSIEYRAGKNHGNADALSRMVDEEQMGEEQDNGEVIINTIHLKPKHVTSNQTSDPDLKWIIDLLINNKVRPALTDFENAERRSLYKQWSRLKLIDNFLYREYLDEYDRILRQYVVPKNEREFILKNSHDTLTCGHLGTEKTMERIIHKYYWYKLTNDVKRYCQECVNCQKYKTSNRYNKDKLKPIYTSRPNQIVAADVFGPLPLSNGRYKYVLVVTDLFTKYVEFFAMETQTAHETARKLMEYISRHSIMDTILTDQGKNFQSELISELWELLDVHKSRTTPYFPSCNGNCERMMRTLQNMLSNYVNEQKNNWDEFLPLLMFAYNTATHSSHKYTPFELQHGRQARVPLDLLHPSDKVELYLTPDSYAAKLQDELPDAYGHVAKNIEMAVLPNKIRHDRKCRAASFAVGDYVWVLDTATLKGVSKKLSHRFKGPYKVVGVIDDANFKLKTLTGKKTVIINKSRLKRCYERKILQEMANDTLQNQQQMQDDADNIQSDFRHDSSASPNLQIRNRNKIISGSKNKKPSDKQVQKPTNTSKPKKKNHSKNHKATNSIPPSIDNDITNIPNVTRANQRPLRTRQKPDRFQAGN